MRPGDALIGVALCALGASGCVYYNAIYNAEDAFDEAESSWSLGRDSLADVRYEDVVRRAGAGFRKEPEGPWADEALYLLGRAHFRRGRLAAAEAALERARSRSTDPDIVHGAEIYLGAIHIRRGEVAEGFRLLNGAMGELGPGPALAEGHLWRARVFMQGDPALRGSAWWDLERAAELNPVLAVPSALERVGWGIRHGEPVRAAEGVERLLATSAGASRRDSLEVLLRRAATLWGADTVSSFLTGLPRSPWDSAARGRLRIARAELLHGAGEGPRARAELQAVAADGGAAATEARRRLARWRLAGAGGLAEVDALRPLLLPVEEDSAVAALLAASDTLFALTDLSGDRPLALFAAGEWARDELGARELARGLFLAYANGVHGEPWGAKALLAALELSETPSERDWIRDRLEMDRGNPYVRAARGDPSPDLAELEAELAVHLQELRRP